MEVSTKKPDVNQIARTAINQLEWLVEEYCCAGSFPRHKTPVRIKGIEIFIRDSKKLLGMNKARNDDND
ncbi:MAG: hypothetical protein PVJ60_03990 [Phycisphaerales bacterium]|jgi:hypothetical protein